jgi:isocitrate dehydrogenase
VFAYQGEFDPTVDASVKETSWEKIKVANPVVFSDGDDHARSVFKMIKNKLIYPYVDLELQCFDLSSNNKDLENTIKEKTRALKEHKVGLTCPSKTKSIGEEGSLFL